MSIPNKINVYHADILTIKADAVVNAANSDIFMGRYGCSGLSGTIHEDFGARDLASAMRAAAEKKNKEERQDFPIKKGTYRYTQGDQNNNTTTQEATKKAQRTNGGSAGREEVRDFCTIPVGQAITTSIKTSQKHSVLRKNGIQYIVHAVAPDCRDRTQYNKRAELLRSAYIHAFEEALRYGAKTIAVPVLGSGIFKGTDDQEFSNKEIAEIVAKVVYEYKDKFDNITVCAITPGSKQEPAVLKEIRDSLNMIASSKENKKSPSPLSQPVIPALMTLPEANTNIISPSRWLTDEQVGMLLTSMLGNTPTIDVYDSQYLAPVNTPGVEKALDARKVILLPGHGITTFNVADILQGAYNHVVRDSAEKGIRIQDFSFVVPINLVGTTPEADVALNHEEGSHWVLATFEPDQERIRTEVHAPGKIPYKMSFIDSAHDSKNNRTLSGDGIAIFNALKTAGFDLGDSFDDRSCGQQNDGWSCGYMVAENAVDLMSEPASKDANIRQHQDTNILLANANQVLERYASQGHGTTPQRSLESQTAPSMPVSILKTAEPESTAIVQPRTVHWQRSDHIPEGQQKPRILQNTPPVQYSEEIATSLQSIQSRTVGTRLFASPEDVENLQKDDKTTLFREQRTFIEETVKQAEQNGMAFKLIGNPSVDERTGAVIYKYHHPEAKPAKHANVYNEADCITYHVKDGNIKVTYGANVSDALIFSMPDEQKGMGAKTTVILNSKQIEIGDTRNKTMQVSQQHSMDSHVQHLSPHSTRGPGLGR